MSTPSPTPGPLQNLYYKRPVGTPKPCSMCYRETRTVLWNPQDFIYICDAHLTDPGFASPVESSASSPGSGNVTVGEDEVKKIKEEWEERQRKKKEKEEKQKAQENGNGDKKEEKSTAASWFGWATGQGDSNNNNASSSPGSATTPQPDMANKKPTPALFSSPGGTPSHQRFILNRQIFSMRQSEYRKKQKLSQANAIAPRLPIVPRNLS